MQGGGDAGLEVVAEGAMGMPITTTLVPQNMGGPVSLRQREEIARAAYKTWFRLRPGHKELKDHWWALYYRKVLPKYHLRDNHLGRKINAWIEEDLRAFNAQHGTDLLMRGEDGDDDKQENKRKKPMSSKEGTLPAYLHVELVHPPPLNSNQPIPVHVFRLASFVHNGDIDWSSETLEEDILWFKNNRQKLMDAIPPITIRPKRSSSKKAITDSETLNFSNPSKALTPYRKLTHNPAPSLEVVQDGLDIVQPYFVCSVPWIRCDLLKSDDAYWLKVDLPGMVPGQDFYLQTDDINKLVVRGERKLDADLQHVSASEFLQQRSFGPFYIELMLPLTVDLSKTEQTFHNGVLTIKCPTKENQWRNISEDIVGDQY